MSSQSKEAFRAALVGKGLSGTWYVGAGASDGLHRVM